MRYFIKDAAGRSRITYITPTDVTPVELAQPIQVLVGGERLQQKRYGCKLCDRRYATAGVFVIHFNTKHKEQATEKDSWRQYVNTTETLPNTTTEAPVTT